MTWTGGIAPPSSFVTSPKCAMWGKWRLVMDTGAFSISLAHTGSTPQRTAASGNTPIPSNRLPSRSSAILFAALPLDGQDAFKGSGGDTQPLGHGDVVFHGLGDGMAADHQHMGTAQQVTAHVDAVFVFLGNGVVEDQGQVQGRADGRKARLVDGAALLRRQFRVFAIVAAPCGGNIRKGSFHV